MAETAELNGLLNGLIPGLLNLPLAGVFAWLYLRNDKRHKEDLDDKIERIRELTTTLISVTESNSALNAQTLAFGQTVKTSLDNSTRVMERFCDQMDVIKQMAHVQREK